MLSPIPRGAQVVLLTLVLCAALFDARYRRIPNWLTVSGVLTGVALNSFLYYPGPAGFFFALKGLGLGFGVYFVLHLLRAMGAGDVKLAAALGCLVGLGASFQVLFAFLVYVRGDLRQLAPRKKLLNSSERV